MQKVACFRDAVGLAGMFVTVVTAMACNTILW